MDIDSDINRLTRNLASFRDTVKFLEELKHKKKYTFIKGDLDALISKINDRIASSEASLDELYAEVIFTATSMAAIDGLSDN